MKNNIHTIKQELLLIALFIGLIWFVFVLDRILPLEVLGLVPRTMSGLTGIVTMPFLHQDLAHIMGNTPPLAVLLALLAGSRGNSKVIVLALIVLGGVLLWLFGRGNALHIGASGLVFALVSFLIAAGIFERRITSLVVSVLVGFFYGTTLLMGVLPGQQGVSWDGHLLGGVAGVVIAWLMLKRW
jgi:membrane associated rhomboid family serine protease